MKEINWLPHARERLAERKIDIKIVQEALKQPDQIISHGRRKIIHKRYFNSQINREYLLRVFIEEERGKLTVRSVYRTSKITKYWRGDL